MKPRAYHGASYQLGNLNFYVSSKAVLLVYTILSCEPLFDYIPLKQLKPKAPNTRGKNSVHGNSTSLLSLAGTICFYLLLNF
ncbi:hypothetical protein D0784_17680 [Vibrio campbellii]|nr:hypothetical protein D0784_17680 [Vibrio campbellii]